MGHEKKKRKKDKDRDGEKKRRRHPSEELGAAEESERRHRRKHKKHKDKSRKRRHSSESPGIPDAPAAPKIRRDEVEDVPPAPPPPRISLPEDPPQPVAEPSGGGGGSLTIEETNRLRSRLGLKPLEIGGAHPADGSAADGGSEPQLGSSDTYAIHKRPDNLGEKRRTERVRDKISSRRKQREMEAKLASAAALGASDGEEDESALAWIQRSRQVAQEKEMASKRAAMLDDLDAEFGVGSLVEEDTRITASAAYSSADLRGLTVAHDASRIGQGRNIILTLEDRNVLDEENSDTLVNVNMVDDERHEKNVNLRKQKPGYRPEEDHDWDEDGNYLPKKLLSQYDEELEGPKRNTFVIGSGARPVASSSGISGGSVVSREAVMAAEDVKRHLRQKTAQTLQMAAPKIATDYYTEGEMATFKRVKKKVRKVRKKVRALKADDLLPMADEPSQHLGRKRNRDTEDVKPKLEPIAADSDGEPVADTDDTAPVEDLSGIKLEPDDNADLHLSQAIERTRRLRQVESNNQGTEGLSMEERLANLAVKLEDEDAANAAGSVNIVLNSTAEFCRSLGDIPTYGMAGNRDETGEDMSELERELAEEREKAEMGVVVGGTWEEVNPDSSAPTLQQNQENSVILEEEPDLGSGVGGALKLAVKKGYVETESFGRKGVSQQVLSHLRAQNYSIDDKAGAEEDRGRRGGRAGGSYNGPVSDFNEKRHYRPEIQLDYIDDQGRLLCSKEAFRYLSHKFHGKGSGKMKTEKREKKFKEERLMAQMNSTDTPLNTLCRLQEKQKQLQSPFVVLSGNSLLNSDAAASQMSKK